MSRYIVPVFVLLTFSPNLSVDAQQTLGGTVRSGDGSALVGVNVVSSTGVGTITDINGNYQLLVRPENQTVQFSYVGFITIIREVKGSQLDQALMLSVVMEEDVLEMDEVVISAGFNQKSKLESSVAITTLDNSIIESLTPVSSLEALKQVPGIYVNDANGEVGVEVEGRGLGTAYFSIQEDGLPSAISEMASNQQFQRDMFLRNDLTVSRIEAVRGGNSAITAANAPGGVFNYISRTGTDRLEFEVRNRFGLNANGKEIYNKLEVFRAGPIEGTDWSYAIGGHYRHDGGSRVGLFPHSQGGQIKGNIHRVFQDKFSINLYGKYLSDRVGLNRPTWVQNWIDIQPVPGFTWNENLILPEAQFDMIDGENSTAENIRYQNINTKDQQRMNEWTTGLKLSYSMGDNWSLNSHTRLSSKSLALNYLAEEGGFTRIDVDGLFARLFSNFNWVVPISNINQVYRNMVIGDFQFYDTRTNETLATIDTRPLLRTGSPVITQNDLPGGRLFWGLVDNDELEMDELVQQLSFTGAYDEHQLTLGGYYHRVKNDRVLNSGTSYLTVEPAPRFVGVRVTLDDFSSIAQFVPELQPLVPFAGQTVQYATPTGLHGFNSQVNEYNELVESVLAFYANDEWTISDKLVAEGGLRYETIKHSGSSGITAESDITERPNGADGDFLTVYDNGYNYFSGETLPVDNSYKALSYSLGVNYKIGETSAIYTRYSKSEKLLDAIYEQDMFMNGESFEFKPRKVSQFELGAKYSNSNLGLFASVYRSVEKNIFNQLFVICITCDNGFYLTDPFFNSVEFLGAEFEFSIKPTNWWNIRSNINISGGKNLDFKIINTGESERPEDDFIVDLSGEPVAGSTANTFDVSPVDITNRFLLGKKKWEFLINYRRFAERYANSQQAFTLPAFHLFKLGVSNKLNTHIRLALNVNNVFNEVGVLRFNGYDAVAGFPENVTEAFIEDNPERWFKVQRSLPRSVYFTVHYTL